MKCLILLFVFNILFACSHTNTNTDINRPVMKQQSALDIAVESAIKSDDFRLYGTTGRKMVLPGISGVEQNKALTLCGYKLMKGTGDVIKSEEQRASLQETFVFMSEYNRQILAICQQRNKEK